MEAIWLKMVTVILPMKKMFDNKKKPINLYYENIFIYLNINNSFIYFILFYLK